MEGHLDVQIHESAPTLQLQYLYKYPFNEIATAFLKKYTWEPRQTLTTFSGVQQVDDDRILFYRRVETVNSDTLNYERVIINRKEQTITSEFVIPKTNGEGIVTERGTIQPEGDRTIHNQVVFEVGPYRSLKIEMFRVGVEKVLKAIKFAQFESS